MIGWVVKLRNPNKQQNLFPISNISKNVINTLLDTVGDIIMPNNNVLAMTQSLF